MHNTGLGIFNMYYLYKTSNSVGLQTFCKHRAVSVVADWQSCCEQLNKNGRNSAGAKIAVKI